MQFVLCGDKSDKYRYLGPRKVLGIYEVLGSFYAFTVGTKHDLDFALKVFEVIPSSYLSGDDCQKELVFWGINPSNSIISKYLKNVYLSNIDEFWVEGKPFELPKELDGLSDRYVRVIRNFDLSPEEICKSRDDLMFEGDVGAIILTKDKFQSKKREMQKVRERYTTPILKRGKILVKEV